MDNVVDLLGTVLEGLLGLLSRRVGSCSVSLCKLVEELSVDRLSDVTALDMPSPSHVARAMDNASSNKTHQCRHRPP